MHIWPSGSLWSNGQLFLCLLTPQAKLWSYWVMAAKCGVSEHQKGHCRLLALQLLLLKTTM